MLTPKGYQERVQRAGQAAIADDADRLIVKQEGIDIAVPEVGFFAPAHQAVAIRDLPRRVNRQPERKLRHLPREAGRRAQDADAPLIASFVIQIEREAARYIHDRFQAPRLIQHIAIMPARCDQDIGARQSAQKVLLRHALVFSPNDIDQVAHPLLVFGREDLVHPPKTRVDYHFAFHRFLTAGDSPSRPYKF